MKSTNGQINALPERSRRLLKEGAKNRIYRWPLLKMLVVVVGTIMLLAGLVVAGFWFVFGDRARLQKFLTGNPAASAAAGKTYENPRLRLDELIRAKIFNTNPKVR